MWIKICGNTNLDDALFAAECGADALGFVFARSARRVQPEQVGHITERLPRTIAKYGVFVDAGLDEIISTVEAGGLDGVQLHRASDPSLPSKLRERGLRILQVLNYSDDFERQVTELSNSQEPVLVDSAKVGGTGNTFNWMAAQSSFQRAQPRLIAAGGLSPENVMQAIQILRPWGVDVASGVESAPGKKDPDRVRAFVEAARQAAADLAAVAR